MNKTTPVTPPRDHWRETRTQLIVPGAEHNFSHLVRERIYNGPHSVYIYKIHTPRTCIGAANMPLLPHAFLDWFFIDQLDYLCHAAGGNKEKRGKESFPSFFGAVCVRRTLNRVSGARAAAKCFLCWCGWSSWCCWRYHLWRGAQWLHLTTRKMKQTRTNCISHTQREWERERRRNAICAPLVLCAMGDTRLIVIGLILHEQVTRRRRYPNPLSN